MPVFNIKPNEEGDPSFFIDDEFQASWNKGVDMPKMSSILAQILKMAYDQGAKDRGQAIKKLLG